MSAGEIAVRAYLAIEVVHVVGLAVIVFIADDNEELGLTWFASLLAIIAISIGVIAACGPVASIWCSMMCITAQIAILACGVRRVHRSRSVS